MISNLNQLLDIAKENKTKTLVIAVAEDKFVLNAVAKAKALGIINPIYIGHQEKIESLAKKLGVIILGSEVIHMPAPALACKEAVKIAKQGKADLLMKGHVSTNVLLKQIVSKDFGLLSGKLLSHLAIFESPNYHKLLGITDAAMNISPNLKDKTEILINAVDAFHALGIAKPKVAILAAIEKVNKKMPATLDALSLKVLSEQNKLGNCYVDGPFALDNAISKQAAKHKGIEGMVAGDADILIAPDINSGNILYKSLSFLGNAKCAAILIGSKVPIILTSRADTEETKLLSIALAVLTSKQ